MDDQTPIEKHGGIFVKRDDLYSMAGIRGGKVRACWHLATRTIDGDGLLRRPLAPAVGLITASARKSPQAQIVARLSHTLGIPARCHMPQGEKTEEMEDMEEHGGELVQHKAGYNSVIIARALADSAARPGWRYIPFGMEHKAAMDCTRGQVHNIPVGVRRIVICIGSGMSAAAVLWGLLDAHLSIPVVGIRIGADPTKRLNKFAPAKWRSMLQVVDVTDRIPYHSSVDARLGPILLDPHYEAKCLEHLERGDLFWVVGIRATRATLNPGDEQ